MILKPADYPLWIRIVVVVTLALFVVNLFFFIAPLTALTSSARDLIGAKEVFTGIGTLFATFIGAWLAFSFARIKENRERIKKEVAAGNLALFTLTQMYSQTVQHQKEIVEEAREKPLPWFSLPVTSPLNGNLSLTHRSCCFFYKLTRGSFNKCC